MDTTQPVGSIALGRDGVIVEERQIDAPDGFSSVIQGELAGLLSRCGVGLRDIDTYAAASGPGSFTGVRIGMAIAKGLAEMHGKRVVPVSNLLAIAAAAQSLDPRGGADLQVRANLVPIIDVRRGEIAVAVYARTLDIRLPPMVATPADIAPLLAAFAPLSYCGADAPRFFPGAIATPRALAGKIAQLAATMAALDPAAADAEYVRRADVRLPAS
jgi:tRNA threonylcarbamoyl adenosine modification protein YeaZ